MKKPTLSSSLVAASLVFLANACASNVDRPSTGADESAVVAATEAIDTPHASSNAPTETFPTPITNPATELVAHAGGYTTEGSRYTNTIDAFIESYNQGFRNFEIDFVRLADGTVLAAHDGLEHKFGLPANSFRTATLQDVQGTRYNGVYRVMLAQDIINLLREYPDITIIADSKWDLGETYRVFFDTAGGDLSVLDRLIPHVGTQEDLDMMRAINPQVKPMLALYRTQHALTTAMTDDEVVDFVIRNNIPSIMMHSGLYDPELTLPENNARKQRYSPELVARLEELGTKCYVHTVNNINNVMNFLQQGIRVYSDQVSPAQVLANESNTRVQTTSGNTPLSRFHTTSTNSTTGRIGQEAAFRAIELAIGYFQ